MADKKANGKDQEAKHKANNLLHVKTKSIGLDGAWEVHPGPKWSNNFFSRLTFWEATPIVRTGASRQLEHTDLWQIRHDMRAEENWRKFSKHWKAETKLPPKDASLFRAIRRTFQNEWGLAIFLQLLYALLSFSTSVLMPYIMQWLTAKAYPGIIAPELAVDWLGYLFLADIVLATLLGSFCMYHAQLIGWRLGIKIRAALTLVAYRKALKLGSTKTRNTGNVVNLIAQDAQLITDTLPFFNQGSIAPVQIIAATGLLWNEIGAYALIPLGVFIFAFPFAGFFGRMVGVTRGRAQAEGDSRIKLVKELIGGIRIVKYMGWEDAFAKNIDVAREKEMEQNKQMSLFRAYLLGAMMSVPNIGVGLTFFAYSYSLRPDENMRSDKIFTALSLLNLLRLPFAFLPMMLTLGSQYAVTFGRMCEYLLQPEVKKREVRPVTSTPIAIKGGSFAWNSGDEPFLKNIDFVARKGELTMVVGSVGHGKSTLLQSLLGETHCAGGTVELNGTIALVAQEAWIVNATVRDNILFGKAWDEKLYKEVCKASALLPDFEMMQAGDLTEIGDKGINLSGGQRQRVSIARALYQDRDIYIMDDPLSAVDSHVAAHLMEQMILGFLRSRQKTVVLALNQIQFLPSADHILYLKSGEIVEQGNFTTLTGANKGFAQLVRDFGITDTKDKPAKAKKEGSSDELIKKDDKQKDDEALLAGNLTGEEGKEAGNIGIGIYWFYIVSSGLGLFLLSVLLLAISNAAQVFYSIWLSDWTNPVKYAEKGYSKETWQGVFLGINIAQAVFLILKGVVVAYTGRNASRHLHRLLLNRILRATTSFFDATPLGRLINRFAKDMGLIDQMLPMQLDQFLNMFLSLLAMFAQLASSSPYILIGVAVAAVIYIVVLQYYRKTSIEIQRLESVSRSPIFSHLTETLEGNATIRAYGMQKQFKVANMNRIDANSIDFYSLRYCGMWFGLRLDWLGTAIIFTVVLAIVLLRNFDNGLDVSLAGLALSTTNGLTLILSAISMNFNELEVKMNSVERIEQYDNIEQEAPARIPEKAPAAAWPSQGKVEFKELSIAYGQGPPVLKKISISIKPKAKIGLVGRTGSGKSTLVTALFRLVEPCNGTILIDGVDICKIGLSDLRTKLSIIPQSPTLFIGSVRYNIDPFNESNDATIWAALERVQLKEVIEGMEGKLDATVEENGQNFSVGQRQLLALARALVRDAKIILLDESTASLSNDSDALVQLMIRQNFKDKTIITIAHRLNTIMDSDKVLVLDKGEVVEYDSPKKLLQAKGVFASMVAATGPSSAEYLRKIAFGEISAIAALEEESESAPEKIHKKHSKKSKALIEVDDMNSGKKSEKKISDEKAAKKSDEKSSKKSAEKKSADKAETKSASKKDLKDKTSKKDVTESNTSKDSDNKPPKKTGAKKERMSDSSSESSDSSDN